MSVSSFGSKSSSFSMKSQAVIDELQKQRQKDAMEKEEYVSEKDNFYLIETCVSVFLVLGFSLGKTLVF